MGQGPLDSDELDRRPTGLLHDPSSHVDTLLALTDLAERLRDRIAGLSTDGRGPRAARRVTVSVGVAELSPEMGDGDALLAAADSAQALARGSGGNSVQTHAPG